jgi:hypothetical protein
LCGDRSNTLELFIAPQRKKWRAQRLFDHPVLHQSTAWFRKLVAGLAAKKPEVNVEFVVDKASLNESFFPILRFPLAI